MVVSRSLPMIEARSRLTNLPEELEREGQAGAVAVTRRGKPVLAILPWELYEGLAETLEIMADKKLTAALRRGLRECEAGKTIPWEEAKKRLRL
ncbi:MAG: type II toxin-antitoxin system Phd/YefM family antitoxin [Bryobacteraceae bacterium]